MQMKKHIIAALVGVMILAVAGPAFAAANVVGGYLVTDRMLKMFHKRRPAQPGSGATPGPPR